MKIENGAVISETSDFPGSHGDACAETARLFILSYSNNSEVWRELNIYQFETETGYLRHPKLWNWWGGENDFSNDQALPLMMAMDAHETNVGLTRLDVMRSRLKWRIPPKGAILSPGVWFLARKMWTMFCLATIAQALVFRLPIRWDDGKKRFARQSESTADWLNYAVSLVYLADCGEAWAVRACLRLTRTEEILARIERYYLPETHRQPILTEYYNALRRLNN